MKNKKEIKLKMTWQDIKRRCNNPNYKDYSNWGGRGIKVEWKSFADFERDLLEGMENL